MNGPVLDVEVGDFGVVHLFKNDEVVGLGHAAVGA